jgi:hypothetical protein
MPTRISGLFAGPVLLLGLTSCDYATEPGSPGTGALRQSVEAAAHDSYTATLLPSAGRVSEAFIVVGDGLVFGMITGDDNTSQAVRWALDASGSASEPVLLGGLPEPWQGASQTVRGSNASGDAAVGHAQVDGGGPVVPWVWADGAMTALPLPGGAISGFANDINETGVILGRIVASKVDYSDDHAAVWTPPYDEEPLLLPRWEDHPIQIAVGITSGGVISGLVRSASDALVQWQIDATGNVLAGPTKVADDFVLRNAARNLDLVGHFKFEVASVFRLDEGRRIDLGMLDGHTFSAAHSATERASDGSIHIAGYSEPIRARAAGARAVWWAVAAGGGVAGPFDLGLPAPWLVSNRPPRSLDFVAANAYSIDSQGRMVGWSLREDGRKFATLWRPEQEGGDEGGKDDCDPHPRFPDRCK